MLKRKMSESFYRDPLLDVFTLMFRSTAVISILACALHFHMVSFGADLAVLFPCDFVT